MTISAVQSFYIPAVTVITTPGITISNLDASGLRIEWSVTRDNTNKPDAGTVTVYNLDPATIGIIYEAWQAIRQGVQTGLSFTLALGWNLVPEIIMQGDISEFIPSTRTPTDVMTTWKIGDAVERVRDAIVGRDFHNVNLTAVLDYFVRFPPNTADAGGGGLGLIFLPDSKALIAQAAAEIPLQQWGNITKGMGTEAAIDAIMETLGLEWRIHNGAFVALRGGLINRPGPTISPQSGLISYTEKDDGGIQFVALADSRFEPGIRCVVLDDVGKPIGSPSYRVESTAFAGSTDEGSLMTVVGRPPTTAPVLPFAIGLVL